MTAADPIEPPTRMVFAVALVAAAVFRHQGPPAQYEERLEEAVQTARDLLAEAESQLEA